MSLRRADAAELIGISEARLAEVEQSPEPLFTSFNWEVLAGLGNEHFRRLDEADLPTCEWLEAWAADLPDDETLAARTPAEEEAAMADRETHMSACDVCRPAVEWSQANPDPVAFLFPAADRPVDRIGRWIPLTGLAFGALAGIVVAEMSGNELFRGAGLAVGAIILFGLQRARRWGYIP